MTLQTYSSPSSNWPWTLGNYCSRSTLRRRPCPLSPGWLWQGELQGHQRTRQVFISSASSLPGHESAWQCLCSSIQGQGFCQGPLLQYSNGPLQIPGTTLTLPALCKPPPQQNSFLVYVLPSLLESLNLPTLHKQCLRWALFRWLM